MCDCLLLQNMCYSWCKLECPAEFRVTKFRRNFAKFFPRIPPELSYGIPYFLRNSIYMRNSEYTEFCNAEFRMLRNSVFLRNSAEYVIPYSVDTEFLRNSAGIPYSVSWSPSKKNSAGIFFDGIMDTLMQTQKAFKSWPHPLAC